MNVFCSLPFAFFPTSLTLPLTSSKPLAPGACGKGCNFVNIKSHFCLQRAAWRRQKSSQGYPHIPFLFVVFFLLQAKQINKPGAGLKSLEGSSLSPGHGLLILAAVLIAVNGFPFSYSLQNTCRTAPGCFLRSFQWFPISRERQQ